MPYENLAAELAALSAEQLKRIATPVFDIVGLRVTRGYDNRFDHFLWDEVGDPYASYNEQGGITDTGTMLYVERATGRNVLEWTRTGAKDDPRAYHVALAELRVEEPYEEEWPSTTVFAAEQTVQAGQPTLVLHLNINGLEPAPSVVVEQGHKPAIAKHLAERALKLEMQAWKADKPRVVLETERRRLYMPGRRPEKLHAWRDVVDQLDEFGDRIAQMLLAETIEFAAAS